MGEHREILRYLRGIPGGREGGALSSFQESAGGGDGKFQHLGKRCLAADIVRQGDAAKARAGFGMISSNILDQQVLRINHKACPGGVKDRHSAVSPGMLVGKPRPSR